jgi:hypothetical protein
MKKLIAFALIALICTSLIACSNKNDIISGPNVSEITSDITSKVMETSVVTDTNVTATPQLGDLIAENGTGIFNIWDDWAVIKAALDKNGVKYTTGDYYLFECPDGSFYDGDSLFLSSTQKGLKLGDSEDKITAIYGAPTITPVPSTWTDYYYEYPANDPESKNKKVIFSVTVEKKRVISIQISRDMSGLSGGASAN